MSGSHYVALTGTYYVQVGLELRDPRASASGTLGFEVCTVMHARHYIPILM